MADEKDKTAGKKASDGAVKRQEDAPELKTVKSGLGQRNGADVVALWEKDPAHPGGEVYIAGDKPVEVALTPEVVKRIREGVLVEV
jgi:hypothetical protein